MRSNHPVWILVFSAVFTVFSLMLSADPGYKYPVRFLGVCYDPPHYDQANNSNSQVTLDAIRKDFPAMAAKGFKVARCYQLSSEAHYLNYVGEAYRYKMKVVLEVPVTPVFPQNNDSVLATFEAFLQNVKKTPESMKGQKMKNIVFHNYNYQNVDYVTPSMFKATVILVLAGNENLSDAAGMDAKLVALKDKIQLLLTQNGFGDLGVTYCLQADVWAGDPGKYPNRAVLLKSLAPGVPFLMNVYPFEWGMQVEKSAEGSANSIQSYVDQITAHYPSIVKKNPIMIGETGWASDGTAGTSSPANLANEATFLSKVYTWMGKKTNTVCGTLFFEAFDQQTKTGNAYEKYFGMWYGGTPSKQGTWKPGLPPPPSVGACKAAGTQNNSSRTAASGAKDTLTFSGSMPLEDASIITQNGISISFEGIALLLSPEKFTVKKGVFQYNSNGVKFKLDAATGKWTLTAKLDLEEIDNRDGLDLLFEIGELEYQFNLDADEISKCIFKAGKHSTVALETDGMLMKYFQAKSLLLNYDNYKKDRVSISADIVFELPEGVSFAPAADVVQVSCDGIENEIPEDSFVLVKDGVYSYKDPEGFFSMTLDFNKKRCQFSQVIPYEWMQMGAYDGLDIILAIGNYKAGLKLNLDQKFIMNCRTGK